MWLVGYFIGVVVGALLVAYSVTYDVLPGMIVFPVMAGIGSGLAVVALLSAWAERER